METEGPVEPDEIEIDPVEPEPVSEIDENLDLTFTSNVITVDDLRSTEIKISNMENKAEAFNKKISGDIDNLDSRIAETTDRLNMVASLLEKTIDLLGRGGAPKGASKEEVTRKQAYNDHFVRVFIPGATEHDLGEIEWEYGASLSSISEDTEGFSFDVDAPAEEIQALIADYGGQRLASVNKTTPPQSLFDSYDNSDLSAGTFDDYVNSLVDFVKLVDSGKASDADIEEFNTYWGPGSSLGEELAYLRSMTSSRKQAKEDISGYDTDTLLETKEMFDIMAEEGRFPDDQGPMYFEIVNELRNRQASRKQAKEPESDIIDNLQDTGRQATRKRKEAHMEVFEDDYGSTYEISEYQPGFWAVQAVDAEGYHEAQAVVPASSAEEAFEEMLSQKEYAMKKQANRRQAGRRQAAYEFNRWFAGEYPLEDFEDYDEESQKEFVEEWKNSDRRNRYSNRLRKQAAEIDDIAKDFVDNWNFDAYTSGPFHHTYNEIANDFLDTLNISDEDEELQTEAINALDYAIENRDLDKASSRRKPQTKLPYPDRLASRSRKATMNRQHRIANARSKQAGKSYDILMQAFGDALNASFDENGPEKAWDALKKDLDTVIDKYSDRPIEGSRKQLSHRRPRTSNTLRRAMATGHWFDDSDDEYERYTLETPPNQRNYRVQRPRDGWESGTSDGVKPYDNVKPYDIYTDFRGVEKKMPHKEYGHDPSIMTLPGFENYGPFGNILEETEYFIEHPGPVGTPPNPALQKALKWNEQQFGPAGDGFRSRSSVKYTTRQPRQANTRRRAGRPGYEFNEEDNRWVPEGSPTFSEWLEDNGYSTSEANDELRQDYDNDTSAAVARHEFLTNGYQSSDQYWDYDTDDFISDDDDDFSWDAIYKALEDEYDVDTIDEIASDHKDAIDNALYGDSPQNAIIDIVRKNANRRKAAMNNRRPRTSNTRRRANDDYANNLSTLDNNELLTELIDAANSGSLSAAEAVREAILKKMSKRNRTSSTRRKPLRKRAGSQWSSWKQDYMEDAEESLRNGYPYGDTIEDVIDYDLESIFEDMDFSTDELAQIAKDGWTDRLKDDDFSNNFAIDFNEELIATAKSYLGSDFTASRTRSNRKATMNNRRAVIARKRAIATRKRELQMDRAIDAMTKAASALVAATNKIANDPEGTVVQDGNESETTRTEHDQDGGLNVTDTQPVTEAEAKSEEVDGTPTIDTVAVSSRRPIKMASSSANNDLTLF